MEKKLNITVSLSVEGAEGMDASISFKDTTMKQVLLIEKAILGKFMELIELQAAGKI